MVLCGREDKRTSERLAVALTQLVVSRAAAATSGFAELESRGAWPSERAGGGRNRIVLVERGGRAPTTTTSFAHCRGSRGQVGLAEVQRVSTSFGAGSLSGGNNFRPAKRAAANLSAPSAGTPCGRRARVAVSLAVGAGRRTSGCVARPLLVAGNRVPPRSRARLASVSRVSKATGAPIAQWVS